MTVPKNWSCNFVTNSTDNLIHCTTPQKKFANNFYVREIVINASKGKNKKKKLNRWMVVLISASFTRNLNPISFDELPKK